MFANEPNPAYTGISISGPSGGLGFVGGTIGSAYLDFVSYADIHAASTGNIIGLNLFSLEGQIYIPWGNRKVENCCESY